MLPICATSIVMLIQNSLPLAFGLTVLVAAVRFRVRLNDALDGIHIFAAICVGLASGIGYLGVGSVMTMISALRHSLFGARITAPILSTMQNRHTDSQS